MDLAVVRRLELAADGEHFLERQTGRVLGLEHFEFGFELRRRVVPEKLLELLVLRLGQVHVLHTFERVSLNLVSHEYYRILSVSVFVFLVKN